MRVHRLVPIGGALAAALAAVGLLTACGGGAERQAEGVAVTSPATQEPDGAVTGAAHITPSVTYITSGQCLIQAYAIAEGYGPLRLSVKVRDMNQASVFDAEVEGSAPLNMRQPWKCGHGEFLLSYELVDVATGVSIAHAILPLLFNASAEPGVIGGAVPSPSAHPSPAAQEPDGAVTASAHITPSLMYGFDGQCLIQAYAIAEGYGPLRLSVKVRSKGQPPVFAAEIEGSAPLTMRQPWKCGHGEFYLDFRLADIATNSTVAVALLPVILNSTTAPGVIGDAVPSPSAHPSVSQ
jgi:hypothetical protein